MMLREASLTEKVTYCLSPFIGLSWASKSLQMVTAAIWKKSYDQPRQHIKEQRHYFADKGPYTPQLWFFH